jgi:hypothetical protein
MGLREQIISNNRLARMRLGQEAPELIAIPSTPDVRMAQVPLTEAEIQRGVIAAASLEVDDNAAGLTARNRACLHSDVFHSLREPADVSKFVFHDVDDMLANLQGSDLDFLADSLTTLNDYASPAVDGLTDKELSELKKAFGETDWSALTGRQWAALKLACTALFPEILAVSLRGSSSTESLTTTTENDESI